MRVFCASPWVPAEWIKAHGLEPRGIWFSEKFGHGSPPFAAGICAFAHSALQLAEQESDSAFVFTTHCDQLRRSYDTLVGLSSSRAFLFNLPATWQTPVAERMFVSELERLGRFLVQLGGRSPSPEHLAKTIEKHSHARRELLDAAPAISARESAEAIARFHWDSSLSLPPAAAPPSPGSPSLPLALVGGPMPRTQWQFLEFIESAGGRIVLNATEPGERNLWCDTERNEPSCSSESRSLDDVLTVLARSYLTHCIDVYQRPNTRLYSWFGDRLSSRQVRGILLWHYVWCDLWRAETQTLRDVFGLPVLPLDADEVTGGTLRNTGRIEAFLESLR